jgi:hypothetical protein
MKYIKTYEEKWNQDIGSYVVMTDNKFPLYFENNVGKITKMYYPGSWFDLEYDNIPHIIQKYLNTKKGFHFQSILFKSKNKEEAEEFIKIKNNTKKYNL